jgi:hypothetical protein
MSPDDLLGDLARAEREEQASADPRWEKLARGELSPSEVAKIRAEAEQDPEVALLFEAYRPLSDATKAQIAERVLPRGVKSSATGARVLPWRRAAWVALPLAAAAGLAVWIGRSSPEPVAMTTAGAPDYVLSVTGGDRAQRSNAPRGAGLVELQGDSKLELVVRPSAPVSGPVTVRAFLVQGGVARAWAPRMDHSSDGVVRVTGTAAELLGGAPGTWDVAFAVGPADSVPADPAVIAAALGADAASRPYQLLVTRVRVVDAR